MEEGTTMKDWFTRTRTVPGQSFGLNWDEDHTISVTHAEKMSVVLAFLLWEELGKLVEGKVERDDQGGLRLLIPTYPPLGASA